MYYPAKIEPDTTGYMISFRDIPEALSAGETLEEARAMAADALLTAMDFYFEDKRPVPPPSKAEEGEELVVLPASAWAKVLLLNEMLVQHVGPSELARRMGTTKQQATRLTDLTHATKIDSLAHALESMGRRLEVSVR